MLIANDHQAMQLALDEARAAAARGEVPVGAVVVKNGKLVARAGNSPIANSDPSAHAEMLALRAAAQRERNYRLDGCDVFVTLEPCAMCASALMQARVRRVVFAASEPKTGAAGSVLNLFADTRLNHHTEVAGGLLANESSALLAEFFAQRRRQQQALATSQRLRDDALRTPDARFLALPAWPWSARYTSALPSLAGLRMHHVDTVRPASDSAGDPAVVCVHGSDSWSYVFRDLLIALSEQGVRALAPDLIGFGRSDKPKKTSFHTPNVHRQVLCEWLEHLEVSHVLWVEPAQRRTGVLDGLDEPWRSRLTGLSVGRLILPPTMGAWQTGHQQDDLACSAPYPDAGHRAGPKALSTWTTAGPPDSPSEPTAELLPPDFDVADVARRIMTICQPDHTAHL